MADMKLRLVLLLGVVSGCFAVDNDAIATAQEVGGVTSQTVVQDSKGGEIKIVTTIRDTSWPPAIAYNPNSFYELLPQLYADKISLREVKLGKLDYVFGLFVSALPRQWQPTSDVVTVWHLDLFDAMTIGAQDANPAIVQAALEKIPYTKSALVSGKSTDFMNQPFSVDGKFRIDQLIDLACDSMATKINKYRVIKWGSTLYAASLATPGISGLTNALTVVPAAKVVNFTLRQALNESVNPCTLKADDLKKFSSEQTANTWVARIAGATALIAAILAHRLQHIYVNGYIKVLDLLVSADTVAYDHALAYKKIKELKNKLEWAGFSNKSAEQLQAVLDKI